PSVVSAVTPYIMFIPESNPFHGPLFGRLNYRRAEIPIVFLNRGLFRLDEEVMESWKNLERGLKNIMFALLDNNWLPRTRQLIPFAYPYRFGYEQTYTSEYVARKAASRAIKAFLPLMGHVSMLLLLTETANKPGWRIALEKSSLCHPEWIDQL
ncbi:hypothetical protein C8J57DRAFT_951706, partial [Mycena rebaudengoi]